MIGNVPTGKTPWHNIQDVDMFLFTCEVMSLLLGVSKTTECTNAIIAASSEWLMNYFNVYPFSSITYQQGRVMSATKKPPGYSGALSTDPLK